MGGIERLHDLQVIDTAIDQLAHRRAKLPSRAAHDAAQAVCKDLSNRLAAAVRRSAEIDSLYASLEKAGADLDAKVTRLEGQLRNVVVTREAEAIQREIASLRAERDTRDEEGLTLLDEAESLAALGVRLQSELERAEVAMTAALEILRDDERALDDERTALVQQRQVLAGELPDGLVSEYETLRPTFNGVAVARLEGAQCTGCHIVLSRVEVEAVRAVPADGRAECPHCARLLAR